jgi:hypothetical protein
MKAVKLLVILTILLLGCKRDLNIAPPDFRTTWVEINVCDHPYNAIPGDTISDSDAFQLAVDVAASLENNNLFDSLNVRIVIPLGEYILDRTLDFRDTQLEIKPYYSILGIEGQNISISNCTITQGY